MSGLDATSKSELWAGFPVYVIASKQEMWTSLFFKGHVYYSFVEYFGSQCLMTLINYLFSLVNARLVGGAADLHLMKNWWKWIVVQFRCFSVTLFLLPGSCSLHHTQSCFCTGMRYFGISSVSPVIILRVKWKVFGFKVKQQLSIIPQNSLCCVDCPHFKVYKSNFRIDYVMLTEK